MTKPTTCPENQEHLQGFMDFTLTPDQEERLRAHLKSCSACTRELALQRQIRSRVAADVPRREVPAELRRKVQEIMTPREARIWTFLPRPALQWGMAVTALILVSLISLTLLTRGRDERIPWIVIEAVNDHRSFAMRVDPPALPTADRQQVRQLVEAKVGLQIDPPTGRGAGLRLVGGDVTYFLDRKVACILYGKGSKLVTLLVLRGEGIEVTEQGFRHVNGLQLYTASHEGTGVVLWRQDDLLYSVISELPPEELLGVAKEMAKI
ncbi:MAG: anti-sigma factor family protein [Candidatus Methylomirabilales bacterium]